MINGILAAEELLASRVSHFFGAYSRQITAAVAVMLFCAGGGAFAVASLSPDPSDLPVRQVFEAVKPIAIDDQLEALDAKGLTLFRSDVTRSSDTAGSLLQRLGASDDQAAAFIRGSAEARSQLFGRAGRTVNAELDPDAQLRRLSVRWIPDGAGNYKRFVLERQSSGFVARTEADALSRDSRLASGVVRTTLFEATDDAGIPDAVSSQLADIFSGDMDFRSLHKGDRFAVIYETFEADGQILRTGRVLSAELESQGKAYQAVWFQEPGTKGGYYRPNGESLQRAYLAYPVEFTRVSSGFAARLHPILNTWRQHHGVDYAAPAGTTVRTVGDGTVDFAGWQSGYGNIVIINHRGTQQTAYAHLSRVDVRTGQTVNQGQRIGAVGSTGWATGPHLHFEFRENGEYEDPSRIAHQEGGQPLSADARRRFDKMAVAARGELAAAFAVAQASAE